MSIETKCYFRMIGLPRPLCLLIKERYLSEIEVEEKPYYLDETKIVLNFPIDEATKSDQLTGIVGSLSGDVKYDFFISICIEEQSAVIDIPEYLLNLHHSVGGKVSFSYTCV